MHRQKDAINGYENNLPSRQEDLDAKTDTIVVVSLNNDNR